MMSAAEPALVAGRTERLLRAATIACSAVSVLLFLLTAFHRIRYPFDLEWIEEGNLMEVARVVAGLPLYVAPHVTYAPYIYAPLFYVVSAFAARWLGVSFATLRLVSVLATLGTLAGIYTLVAGEFAGRGRPVRLLAGVVGVGFFAALYAPTLAFFDLARVDMLCLFFVAWALVAGRRGLPVIAAVLWLLAFESKQGVLPMALLTLCFEWQRPRRIALGLGTFAVLTGATVAWQNHATDGWFVRYIFGTAGGFPIVLRQVVWFIPEELVKPMAIPILLLVAALLCAPRSIWRSRVVSFYAVSGVALITFSWYLRAHTAASINANLPAYLWIATASAAAFGWLYERTAQIPLGPGWSHARPLLLIAACVHLLLNFYPPGFYAPLDQASREAFTEQMRALPGDVLIFDHPEYALLGGHREFAGGEVIVSLLPSMLAQAPGLRAEYAELVHERRLAAIVLDDPADSASANNWLPADFRDFYPMRVLAAGAESRALTAAPVWINLPCPTDNQPLPAKLLRDGLVDRTRCPPRQ